MSLIFSNLKNNQKHPFHLVDPSPWPFVASIGALSVTFGAVLYMHNFKNGFEIMLLGICILIFVVSVWWRDVVREATFEGQHTKDVQIGLRSGMLLFIVSEIMFFFAFFWAFFHSSLSPSFDIGGVFPPVGIEVLNPWEIPLLNTLILLSSGATITWSHHAIIAGSRKNSILGLIITVFLAILFTLLQAFEYCNAPFSISDGIYGSTFFLTTGFHGVHVFLGTCFLVVCLVRLFFHNFTREHHFGFEAAAWYWHFVDVVWLFVFVTVYWWGS
uniref:Cytochrome c oxidase subunit 3 n=1 Tax=Aureoumbra lagunensis TaxID=44058 RepID=A0A7U0KSV9_9STRA|nr:cytochrome c oxidase subunit 3 [Aureoumbra lagunensis]QQW50415.1 cytochrome c oxidase subunit 3 [Aureoumbra lagunensis]